MNVMEAIIPCQRPSQNPATLPSASGELNNSFDPAVHPANANNIRAMIKKLVLSSLRLSHLYKAMLRYRDRKYGVALNG